MCGTCRVTVGKDIKFTCVDGPEFDGHLVDWNEFMNRLIRYRPQEKIAMDAYTKREG
jgi:ferredoxin--NADP+ reductase